MTTNNALIVKCPLCGSKMNQVGAEGNTVLYHCVCCGHNTSATMEGGDNSEYMIKKTELLSRVTSGLSEWKTASWDHLRKDVLDLMSRYEDARTDIRLNMAVLACVTHGFHYITPENYKECKNVYKLTERMYKIMLRSLKKAPDVKTSEHISDYKQNRTLYKKCRNDYRNTKMAWKVLFFFFRKLLLT